MWVCEKNRGLMNYSHFFICLILVNHVFVFPHWICTWRARSQTFRHTRINNTVVWFINRTKKWLPMHAHLRNLRCHPIMGLINLKHLKATNVYCSRSPLRADLSPPNQWQGSQDEASRSGALRDAWGLGGSKLGSETKPSVDTQTIWWNNTGSRERRDCNSPKMVVHI